MLNRINAVPPTNRGAPCTMVSNVTGAQECDARDDDSSTTVDNIKKSPQKKLRTLILYFNFLSFTNRWAKYHLCGNIKSTKQQTGKE